VKKPGRRFLALCLSFNPLNRFASNSHYPHVIWKHSFFTFASENVDSLFLCLWINTLNYSFALAFVAAFHRKAIYVEFDVGLDVIRDDQAAGVACQSRRV
jgi:hypothetical protein